MQVSDDRKSEACRSIQQKSCELRRLAALRSEWSHLSPFLTVGGMNTSGGRRRVLVLLLTGATLGQLGPGCVPSADIEGEGREDRESDLTGGEAASASDFPST